MSLCYDSEKWLMITLASVSIGLTVGLVFLVGNAYGQDSSNSMVDKLIEDTKRDQIIADSYRDELINRIDNSTCMHYHPSNDTRKMMDEEWISDMNDISLEIWEKEKNNPDLPISMLEKQVKECAVNGWIK